MAAETSAAPGRVSLKASGRVALRQALSRLSRYVLLFASLIGVAMLAYLLIDTIDLGASRLSWDFLTNYPSRRAEDAGLRSSIIGSIWVIGTTIVIAVPIALGTAIWIEEFAPKNRFTRIVNLNLANLAGVPSIIYGILGLAVFVRLFGMETSILAGACTLALMIMPMTVITAQEAIRQVPPSIRDGSLALGASRWQTVWHHVLPQAAPGMITGTILAISRAAGETAALIMVGAFAFIAFDNTSLRDDYTTIPVQIYNWTIRPQQAFRENAAAAIIVLMVGLLSLNLFATILRERFRRY
jgi:phosphate transport system permease protein